MTTTAVATRNTYTEQERREAMICYAHELGRSDGVERLLAAVELGHITYKTVREWATRSRKEQYEQIRSEHDRYIRNQLAESFQAVSSRAVGSADESVRQYDVALKSGRVRAKDLPRGAREMATTAAILTDKAQLLSGNPTEIVRADTDDILIELRAVGIAVQMPQIELPKALPEQAESIPAALAPAQGA